MTTLRSCILTGSIVGFAAVFSNYASATAQIGGSISVSAGDSSAVSRSVPTTTPQDTFALAASSSGIGSSAEAQIRGDAFSPSIGLAASAISGAKTSSASAFVALSDMWTIGVPGNVPVGSAFTLPVSFRLEGNVSTGALFGDRFGRFVDVVGALGQFGTASGVFRFNERISGTGAFDQTYTGIASFTNYGPTVPTLAVFEISLSMPFLQLGAVDFYNSLSASVNVPQGFTVASSSGTTLFLTTPVPEPEPYLLFLAGLGVLGAWHMRRAGMAISTFKWPAQRLAIGTSCNPAMASPKHRMV